MKRRRTWSRLTVAMAVCLLSSALSACNRGGAVDSGPTALSTLLMQVTRGGYVLFFRHAARDTTAISNDDLSAADARGTCVSGSELTAQGTADSIALGAAFRRYGISVARVYASPTCRTTEMARLAFNDFEVTRALAWPGMLAPGDLTALTPLLRELLGTPPPTGQTIVLISHSNVLTADRVGLEVSLDQADAAVFRPLGNGLFEVVGNIPRTEWLAGR